MKRRDFIRHLEQQGCVFKREGANHTIYTNPANGRSSTVPRHTEIGERLVQKICDDLEIPHPQ